MRQHKLVERRHPIFSPVARALTLLLIGALAIAVYLTGGRAFSPGDLSAVNNSGEASGGFHSHAEFGDNCNQCHAPFQGVEANLCETCHLDVAQQRQTATGTHGRFNNAADCAACHQEHRGSTYDLKADALANFDHELTRFSLIRHEHDYAEQPMACVACHLQESDFTPVLATCAGCHGQADPAFIALHTEAYGADCLTCHDGLDTVAGFTVADHAEVFALTGAHRETTCAGCHAGGEFEGRPSECVACHAEPAIHAGLFGTNCADCHTSQAWQPARLLQHTFPLDHGGEGDIACATCHTATFTAYTCFNCHEHEPADVEEEHLKEDISPVELPNCAQCHPTGRKDEAEEEDD